ncbi:MAG TPA: DUF4160 domain-containing protein [Gemmatimonadaceae bacterium]|jgi:hypothetical protein|nr:DUF4160 domain-containing protein [Gemmatimonadaceae bacterium]
MPTVLRVGPYRFFFYAGDRAEPLHVHVERDDAQAKFWLEPVRLARSDHFARAELQRVETLVETHQSALRRAWNEYFID